MFWEKKDPSGEDKLRSEGKIIEKDLGFIEDIFGMLCDMVAFEDHCDNSFLSTNDTETLKDKNWMRVMRTKYLNSISDKCIGNDWCKAKHICRIAKGLQESCSRFLSMDNEEKAKECIKDYGECYLRFLKLMKVNDKNIKNETSA